MAAKRATKDEIELHKVFMELPKIGVTIVAFLASTSALILRLSPGSGAEPGSKHWIFRLLFAVGIVVTIFMFVRAYEFLTHIAKNAADKWDDGATNRDEDFDKIMSEHYISFKNSLRVSVLVWIGILLLFTVFL